MTPKAPQLELIPRDETSIDALSETMRVMERIQGERENLRIILDAILNKLEDIGKGLLWKKSNRLTFREDIEEKAGFTPTLLYKIPQNGKIPLIILTKDPLPVQAPNVEGPIPITIQDGRITGPCKNEVRQINVDMSEADRPLYARNTNMRFYRLQSILIVKPDSKELTTEELLSFLA